MRIKRFLIDVLQHVKMNIELQNPDASSLSVMTDIYGANTVQ